MTVARPKRRYEKGDKEASLHILFHHGVMVVARRFFLLVFHVGATGRFPLHLATVSAPR